MTNDWVDRGQMIGKVLANWFLPSQYIPHGHCYLWQTPLVGLHIVSDALIAIAYFSIPLMLLYFIKKRSDIPFSNIFALFGAFILLCGTGHLLEVWTLWHPDYWVSGLEKALTALVSCYTAFCLVELLPQFLALKTPEDLAKINQQLEIEIGERQRAESILHHAYDQLEQRVEIRTAELIQANAALEKEIQERAAVESALRKSEATLQQVAERERATAQIIQQMRQSLKLESIFAATTQELRQAINCDRVIVYRFNLDWSGEIIAEAVAAGWRSLLEESPHAANWTDNVIQGDRCTVKLISDTSNVFEDTYLVDTQGGIYRQGLEYLPVEDIYTANFTPCYIKFLEQLQARAYLIVPIFCGHHLWGLLAIYQNASCRHWEETEIKMVVQIGNQLGVAIQQSQLLSQTQQQAEELQIAKEAADAANRAKSEFLANMSHELRTPLNAILGFTQIMSRDDSLPDRYQQPVSIINRSGEHLLDLINDILEMSKIEAGRTTLHEEDFDFHKFLSTLEDMLQLIALSKGLQFIVQQDARIPRYIRSDQGKLRQILINLLGNAIKFTDEGRVTLRVQTMLAQAANLEANQQDGLYMLHFEVEDTGPGIAPEEIPDLFVAFKQTQVGVQSRQGTGLGLPISQRYVCLMGGEIAVESRVGQGTTFSFSIQVQPAQQAQTVSQVLQEVVGLAPGQESYRILVAEDNLNNCLLITNWLKPLGFEVEVAGDGLDTIALWETWQPHLIWMDMRMPNVDGYEATRRIRSRERVLAELLAKTKVIISDERQPTKIIALTASAFEEQRQLMMEAGCDDFMRKPVKTEDLLEKIRQHLGVQFVYRDDPRTTSSQIAHSRSDSYLLEAESLASMPTDWIEQLHYAAALGSDDLIVRLIQQIPEDCQQLANALNHLASIFQFDRIIALTEPLLQRNAT